MATPGQRGRAGRERGRGVEPDMRDCLPIWHPLPLGQLQGHSTTDGWDSELRIAS